MLSDKVLHKSVEKAGKKVIKKLFTFDFN
jgi:hypothetical protein